MQRKYMQIVSGNRIMAESYVPSDSACSSVEMESFLTGYILDMGERVQYWLNRFLHNGEGESNVKKLLGEMTNLTVQVTYKTESEPQEPEVIPMDDRVTALDPRSSNFHKEVKQLLGGRKEEKKPKGWDHV